MVLSEEEYVDAQDQYGDEAFTALIGAEALKEILENTDWDDITKELRQELEGLESDLRRNKIIKRLKIIEGFMKAKIKPEWMIMDVVPVLPPDLRPLVPLDGGRFATSDLNDLYRRVINRNNRLKRLISLNAPDIILRNEKRMLQEAVDALFDNGRRGRVITGTNKRPLKSLSDILKGKQGRFRQNLLGKRVDYSGRSVIVVGPELKLHQCGIPKKMALELFKPMVYAKLEKYGIATTIKAAKKMVESERPEVWDILEEAIREHPVLLNRAPTLHRLGIQAFEPKLIEGKAIQLHPLVCKAFNADFDGDQMAIHIPLSIEAQLEARVLIMSTNNILSPANGAPIIVPTKDVVLGLYYLTTGREGMPGEGMNFGSIGEIEHAIDAGIIHLHSKIKTRFNSVDKDGNPVQYTVDTTPGRMILSTIFPKNHNLPFDLINRPITSKEVSDLVAEVYRYCGQKATVIFADQLVQMGFKYVTMSGISFGKDNLLVPSEKEELVNNAKAVVKEFEKQYFDGLITKGEKENKVIDAWSQCADKVANAMLKELSKERKGEPINPVFMMAKSGARGSAAQMRQLAGMRGLMAKPNGEIIETPIISNFKEGLTVLEYFTSTHGARKGLSDTALKTANSGYLTRRLVDVAQDVIVVEEDCGVKDGLIIESIVDADSNVASLGERVLGRSVAEDIINPLDNSVLMKASTYIEESEVEQIVSHGIDRVLIRSALTCQSKDGVCATCYGRDLARGVKVNIGEAVGVIAAQSIGEPGTQLTMRTFHVGGTAERGTEKSSIEGAIDGSVKLRDANLAQNSEGFMVVMGRYCELGVCDTKGREKIKHKIPFGAKLLIKDGDKITKGQKLAEWDPYTMPLVAEKPGEVSFVDLTPGISLKETTDESTGLSSYVVMDWRQAGSGSEKLKPHMKISSGSETNPYYVPVSAILSVNNGAKVKAGDVLARIPLGISKTKDITGGLPRVAELFEGRKPKDPAIMSEIDGKVEINENFKGKRKIAVRSLTDEDQECEYLVPRDKHVNVFNGDTLKKGEVILDGNRDPHDILRIQGIKAFAEYLITEIQAVYRLQGVKISDKHIEVIVSQMLRKVEITSAGDSTFIMGEEVERDDVLAINKELLKEQKNPVIYRTVLQGITKAALHTNSFLSSASFQETTRVLTDAAISKRRDGLRGLKENIIVGRLIPAGSGYVYHNLRQKAAKLDRQALTERSQAESSDDKDKSDSGMAQTTAATDQAIA